MNEQSNGRRHLSPVLPASEDAFVAALDRELSYREHPLRATEEVRER
jgi:hypothetical protein